MRERKQTLWGMRYEPAFTIRYEWATKITVRSQQNSTNYVRFAWT